MTQYKKYIWLIETLRRHGKLSFNELANLWVENKSMSDYHPLHRGTFNRWRKAIEDLFGIIIECQSSGGFFYCIKNPEEIEENCLRQYIIDSIFIGNIICDNFSLKNRIIISEVPSSHKYLEELLNAMKGNHKVKFSYKPFGKHEVYNCQLEPYCVRLFDNRWYLLGNTAQNILKFYGLERIISLEICNETFKLPQNFDASVFFANYYGIVVDKEIKPGRIIIQANKQSKDYIKSLPLHPSQKLIEENEDYAEFELYLSPTYDFIMKLLQHGSMIEVLKPESLRQTMKGWIRDLTELYN